MGGDRAQDAAGVSGGRILIDPEFLSFLACPICEERPPFRVEGKTLICTLAGHKFAVVDGVPHLLPEDVIDEREPVNGG